MRGLESFFAFIETVKRGTFAAAARELGTTPSTLAKSVGRLETTLGLRLFYRTTRQVNLTPDGERLFDRCSRVVAELEELRAEAMGASAAPTGTLRVDLPVVLGRKLIVPVLASLASKHPQLNLDVRLSDAYANLVKDRIDLAVRIGTLPDSSLVARRFASQDWILCASPAYIAKHGAPADIGALAAHPAILFRVPTTGRDQIWQFRQARRAVAVRPQARFRFSDGEAMAEAAQLGLGIAQLPDYMVSDQITSGALVELLPNRRPASTPIHAVIPANRLVPARVRVALEALEQSFPANPVIRLSRLRKASERRR